MGSIVNEPVRILVVEDSPTQAENLRYMLEQQGYKVSVARNGEEALQMIGRNQTGRRHQRYPHARDGRFFAL